MKHAFILGLFSLTIAGCTTSHRSISQSSHGYNWGYRGELSPMRFIKEVSNPDSKGYTQPIKLEKSERVIVMQSGQLYPDAALLQHLTEYDVIPMSGIPDEKATGGATLLDAAQAGGVKKILAYWGNIETTVKPEDGKAVSWIPIAGWYVPDESQTMRISMTAIVADVNAGRWYNHTAHSSESEITHSNYSSQRKDNEQIETLKAEAFQNLAAKLGE